MSTMAAVVRREQAETGESEMLACLPPASQAAIHIVNGTTPDTVAPDIAEGEIIERI